MPIKQKKTEDSAVQNDASVGIETSQQELEQLERQTVAALEPELPAAALEKLQQARARYTAAVDRLAESDEVVERLSSFLSKRIAERSAVRASQRSGARAAALGGTLEQFVNENLERFRVELGDSGRRFASPAFGDIELLQEFLSIERAARPELKLVCAETGEAAMRAQADVLGEYVAAYRLDTVRTLLPAWQRDRAAVKLDTSKDGVAHISKFRSSLIADADRIRKECEAARSGPIVSVAATAFWNGNEVESWDAQLTQLLRSPAAVA